MKVIFLDHDGVICLSTEWGSRLKKRQKYCSKHGTTEYSDLPVEHRFDNFNGKAIRILNEILAETDAEIVISSDWKMHATLEELGMYFEQHSIIKKPIALTPNLKSFDPETAALFGWKGWLERARCLEIQKWLSENLVTRWVAVDDLNMSNEFLQPGLENFVLTPRSSEGIKQSGIKEKIINFLK
jgi:hypothetical protein